MIKHLMTTAAVLAVSAIFAAAPAFAQETETEIETEVEFSKEYTEVVNVNVDNDVKVDLTKVIDVRKTLTIGGHISIAGAIKDITESAMATIDNKQVVDDNDIRTTDDNDAHIWDVTNKATGNIQINVAAGHVNAQDNSAAIAITNSCRHCSKPGKGSADAEAFVLQKSVNNTSKAGSRISPKHWSHNKYSFRKIIRGTHNDADVSYIMNGAAGNLQMNAAAGNGNMQKNALTLAVVQVDAVLSEASAAVLQQNTFNTVTGKHANSAKVYWIMNDTSGNIQANVAAGNFNAQANTLSVAVGDSSVF